MKERNFEKSLPLPEAPSDVDRELTPSQAAEKALITRARDGDAEAWNALYRQYRGLVERTIGDVSAEGIDKADVVQDVFLRIHQYGLASYNFTLTSSFRAWLMTIARNVLTDHRRSTFGRTGQRPRIVDNNNVIEMISAPQPDPEMVMLKLEKSIILDQAMQRLRDPLKMVAILRFQQEMTIAEIASKLGVSQEKVESYLFQAKQKIHEMLSKQRYQN